MRREPSRAREDLRTAIAARRYAAHEEGAINRWLTHDTADARLRAEFYLQQHLNTAPCGANPRSREMGRPVPRTPPLDPHPRRVAAALAHASCSWLEPAARRAWAGGSIAHQEVRLPR